MSRLEEVTVGDLTGLDVGLRVVITQEGVAFDGMLTDLDVSRSDYIFKDRPRITARIVVKSIETQRNLFDGVRETVKAEVKLVNLPLDYRIQIESDPK